MGLARKLRMATITLMIVALGAVGAPAQAEQQQATGLAEVPADQHPRDDYTKLAPGLRALLEDVRDGTLNEQAFVNHGYAKLGFQGNNPPQRYRDESLTEQEHAFLALVVNDVLQKLPHGVRNGIVNRITKGAFDSPPAAQEPSITALVPGFAQCDKDLNLAWVGRWKCKHSTPNFEIWYNVDGDRPVDTDDGPVPHWTYGIPGDGIPNYIQRAAGQLEVALYDYANLGYKRPNNDPIVVLYGSSRGGEKDAFTPPTSLLGARNTIWMGNKADEWSTPRHEVFHVHQYAYMKTDVINKVGNFVPLQSWMEATAEWATHQSVRDEPAPGFPDAERYDYAKNLVEFLGRPNLRLTHWDGFAQGRQYGGFIVAEFLEERFGPDVIRKVWENIASSDEGDPGIQLANTVEQLGSHIVNETIAFARASYQLCGEAKGGHPGDPWGGVWHLTDPDIPAWCDLLDADSRTTKGDPFPKIPRPARQVVNLQESGTVSGDVTVYPGGSAYLDITAPQATSDKTWRSWIVALKAKVEQQVGFVTISTMYWKDFPTRAYEDDSVTPLPDFDQSVRMGPCGGHVRQITLVFTHHNPAQVDYQEPPAKVHWEVGASKLDSAGITNGTVQLGVSKYGTLIQEGCGPSTGEGVTSLGLRYVPTGAEALAHPDPAHQCPCEGWGTQVSWPVGAGAYSTWAHAGRGISGLPGSNTGHIEVVSFEATDSTAKSVLKVEHPTGDLIVEHEFVPSARPELYQVKVTVRAAGEAADQPHVTYRRVMNWNVEPTARQELLTTDAAAPGTEYVSDDGFASPDPAAGRTKLVNEGEINDGGPYDQGSLFDLNVPMTFDPVEGLIGRMSVYYGAAGTTADANAALDALGIETAARARANTTGSGAPNVFIFGYVPHH